MSPLAESTLKETDRILDQYEDSVRILELEAQITALRSLKKAFEKAQTPFRNSLVSLRTLIRDEIEELVADNLALEKQIAMLRTFVKSAEGTEEVLSKHKQEMKMMKLMGGAGAVLLPILGYAYGRNKRRRS